MAEIGGGKTRGEGNKIPDDGDTENGGGRTEKVIWRNR